MIEVKFFKEEIHEARSWAKERLASKNGLASQDVRVNDSEIVGRLGELAFKKYLDRYKIDHIFIDDDKHIRNVGDEWDFIVDNKKIDVKSSYHYKTIVINDRQLKKMENKAVDILVGVYFGSFPDGNADLNTAYLLGKASPKDISTEVYKTCSNGKQLFEVPLEKLIPLKHDNIKIE